MPPWPILLVDDDPVAFATLRRHLRDHPEFRVSHCQEASQLLEALEREPPQVVLLDLYMPGVAGMELLDRLRATGTGAEVPVVMLSAEEDPVIKARAFAAGANDYMVKFPATPELVARIGYHARAFHDRCNFRFTQRQLRNHHALLECVGRLQSRFIGEDDPELLFDALLADLLELTGSEFGFITALENDPQGIPFQQCLARSNIVWEERGRRSPDSLTVRGTRFHAINGLLGAAIATADVVVANDPPRHPRAGGQPVGDPPLTAFFGLPIKVGRRLVGQIGLANRPGGYGADLAAFLDPVQASVAQIIQAMRGQECQRQAEAALKESEENFRLLAEAVEDAFWLATPQLGELLYVNPALGRIWGVEGLEKGPDRLLAAVVEADRPRVAREIRAASEGSRSFVYRIARPDGEVRWIGQRLYPIHDSLGTVYRLVGLASDITGRLEAERRLQEQSAVLGATLESGRDGVLVVDGRGGVVAANAKFAQMWGIPPELMATRDEVALLAHVREQLQEPEAFLRRVRELYTSAEIDSDTLQFRDGRVFERYSAPLLREGEIFGRVWNFADVTERWQAEETLRQAARELRASERRLREILDNTPAVVVLKDLQGRHIFVNATFQRLFGIGGDELVGRTGEQLFPTEVLEALRENDQQALDRNGPITVEERVPQADGLHTYLSVKFPLQGADGRPYAVCVIATDITARKGMEEDLRQAKEAADAANQAKSAFLATMSHEIRTPLNAILGMVELLQETHLSPEQLSWLTTAGLAGEALLALINDILDLSKIEAGQLDLEHIPFELEGLLRQVVGVCAPMAREKGISLGLEMEPGLPAVVRGDPGRLRQVLLNLLSNGVKFTHRGEVLLQVSLPAAGVVGFGVRDTGIGIPAPKLSTIFSPFTQVDSSTTRRYGGTGLGLTICQRLVHHMGGEIRADSREGEGSLFQFRLPLPEAVGEGNLQPRSAVGGMEARLPPRALRILLVEDAEDNRKLIEAYLKKTPHRLVMAENGREAVTRFKEGRFDLVLMDIQMPVMDGYEAARRIRRWEGKRGSRGHTPVVALTAHATREVARAAEEAGCDLHLTKPIRKQRLLEVLEGLTTGGGGEGS